MLSKCSELSTCSHIFPYAYRHVFNGPYEEVISLQLASPQIHLVSQHKLVYKPTLKGNKRDGNLTAHELLAGLQETMQQGMCED